MKVKRISFETSVDPATPDKLEKIAKREGLTDHMKRPSRGRAIDWLVEKELYETNRENN